MKYFLKFQTHKSLQRVFEISKSIFFNILQLLDPGWAIVIS